MQMFERHPLPELPATVLARILQHVPQQQRLPWCALVSKAWATATDMTTVELAAATDLWSDLPWIQAVVNKQSHRLTVLTLSPKQKDDILHMQPDFTDSLPVHLPCDLLLQLSSLHLHSFVPQLRVQDTAADGSATPSRVLLPNLRTLQLLGIKFNSVSSLLQLTQLGNVTDLTLRSIKVQHGSAAAAADSLGEAVQQLLQSMPHLARLSLLHIDLGPGSISQLPSSLTHLSLDGVGKDEELESQSCLARSISHLPLLQELHLQCTSFYPSVLTSMPQLQSLVLAELYLLPRAAPAAARVAGHPGEADFLTVVASLQQLQHLELCCALDGHPQLQLYTGLTASSQLTYLSLSEPEGQLMPHGAAQRMFVAGRVLAQLQSLTLRGACDSDVWCVTAAELRSAISACPNLRRLEVPGVVEAGGVQALLNLPACCSELKVGGWAFDDASARVIAGLTQLADLEWCGSARLTDAGFEQLTALTRLTRLHMYDMAGLSTEVAGEEPFHGHLILTTSVEPPEEPDVWHQMRERCFEVPGNGGWKARLVAEAEEKQQHIHELQQQIEELQRQLAELQRQLAERT